MVAWPLPQEDVIVSPIMTIRSGGDEELQVGTAKISGVEVCSVKLIGAHLLPDRTTNFRQR